MLTKSLNTRTYTYMAMATKTLTITVEAYDRLKHLKKDNESFSQVINRITPKHSILDLAGLISPKTADKLLKARKKIDMDIDKEIARRWK
jgi:predicted CopG family antitoxin